MLRITGGKGSEYNAVQVSGNAVVHLLNVRESCLVPARKDRKSRQKRKAYLIGRHNHHPLFMLERIRLLTFSMNP